MKRLKQDNDKHRDKSHEYYTEATSCCSREWLEITSLEQKEALTDGEKMKLDQGLFALIIRCVSWYPFGVVLHNLEACIIFKN